MNGVPGWTAWLVVPVGCPALSVHLPEKLAELGGIFL